MAARQFLSILSLGVLVAVLWAVGWLSGRIVASSGDSVASRHFRGLGREEPFYWRLFELNERLKRIEHKVNAQKDL